MTDAVVVHLDFGGRSSKPRVDGQERQRPTRLLGQDIPKGVATLGVLRAPSRPVHHQHSFAFLPDAEVVNLVDVPTRSRVSLNLAYQVTQSDEDLNDQVRQCEVLYTDTSGTVWSYSVTGLTVAAESDGWTIELHLSDRTEVDRNNESEYKDCVVVCCGDREIHTNPFRASLAS